MNELFDVKNKIVLVSGGSRGIGFTIAEALSSLGAKLIITGRNNEQLAAASTQITCSPHSCSFKKCDVENVEEIEECVNEVEKKYGRIDVLFNCAGINTRKPAIEITLEEYNSIMDINLRGAFFISQAVGRRMMQQGQGKIINIDSLSSYNSLANVAPYAMSKSGLSSMTRQLATEWGPHGVNVNGIAPGFILTELTKKLWSDKNLQAWNQTACPLQRMGTMNDLLGAAIFLASPASDFMTGQILRVDGGVSAGIAWPIKGDFEIKLKKPTV